MPVIEMCSSSGSFLLCAKLLRAAFRLVYLKLFMLWSFHFRCPHCIHRADRQMRLAIMKDDGEEAKSLLEASSAQALVNTAIVHQGDHITLLQQYLAFCMPSCCTPWSWSHGCSKSEFIWQENLFFMDWREPPIASNHQFFALCFLADTLIRLAATLSLP